jgi:hypothetical protein
MNADVRDPTHKETRKISESRLMAVRLRRFDVRRPCATIDGLEAESTGNQVAGRNVSELARLALKLTPVFREET